MSTLEIILTSVVSVIGLVIGGQGVLFYNQNKRLKKLEGDEKSIENDTKVSDGWQEYAEKMVADRDKYEDKYENKDKEYQQAIKKCTDLECENIKLKMTHCEIPNCANRQPPTGY